MPQAYVAKASVTTPPDVPPGWDFDWDFPGPFPPGYTPEYSLGLSAPIKILYNEEVPAELTLYDHVTYPIGAPDDPLVYSATIDGVSIDLKLSGGSEFVSEIEVDYEDIGDDFWGGTPTFLFDIDESNFGDTVVLTASDIVLDQVITKSVNILVVEEHIIMIEFSANAIPSSNPVSGINRITYSILSNYIYDSAQTANDIPRVYFNAFVEEVSEGAPYASSYVENEYYTFDTSTLDMVPASANHRAYYGPDGILLEQTWYGEPSNYWYHEMLDGTYIVNTNEVVVILADGNIIYNIDYRYAVYNYDSYIPDYTSHTYTVNYLLNVYDDGDLIETASRQISNIPYSEASIVTKTWATVDGATGEITIVG